MFNMGGSTEAGSVKISNGMLDIFRITIHTYLSAETLTSSNIIMTYINQI